MNVNEIYNEICKLKLIDLSNLILMLENKFSLKDSSYLNNISHNKPIEKNIPLNIKLVSISNKLLTIKTIKNFLNCDLKTAKSYTDNLPKILELNLDIKKNNDLYNELKKINCVIERV